MPREMDTGSLVNKFADSTTVHGIRDLYHSRSKKFRFIWSIILMAALSGLTYGLVNISIQFHQEPTASLMRVEPPHEFPDVVYCPRLWANPKYLKKYRITAHLYAFIDSLFYASQFSSMFSYKEISVEKEREILVARLKNMNGSLQDLIELIRYTGGDVARSAETKQVDFVPTEIGLVRNLAGACISLTPVGTGVEPRAGYLRMIVRFAEHKIDSFIDRRFRDDSSVKGWIYIGQKAKAAYPEGGFPMDQAMDYNIQLDAKFIERISTRSHYCKPYTPMERSQCIVDCYNTLFEENSQNCTFYNPAGKKHTNDSTYHCSRLDKSFFGFWYYLDLSVCDGKCDIPCKQSTFTITAFSQKSIKNVNGTLLTMYFADPQNSVFVTERKIYTIDNFLSNLGGLVSLFFGASILSLGQLFWYFCIVPLVRCDKRKKDSLAGMYSGD